MENHARSRNRLLEISRAEMARRHLQALLDGYKSGELTAEDIFRYTSIEPEQLEQLVQES